MLTVPQTQVKVFLSSQTLEGSFFGVCRLRKQAISESADSKRRSSRRLQRFSGGIPGDCRLQEGTAPIFEKSARKLSWSLHNPFVGVSAVCRLETWRRRFKSLQAPAARPETADSRPLARKPPILGGGWPGVCALLDKVFDESADSRSRLSWTMQSPGGDFAAVCRLQSETLTQFADFGSGMSSESAVSGTRLARSWQNPAADWAWGTFPCFASGRRGGEAASGGNRRHNHGRFLPS